MPSRIAAATMKPRKTSAITIFSFQSARATATTATTTIVETKALRAASPMPARSPPSAACRKQRRTGPGNAESGRAMLASPEERVCLDARRHGVVLARPLGQALVVAGAGAFLLVQPWPLQLPGAALVVGGALVSLRAVWRWERARLVVTTEKLFIVDGTLRRRASAVRLRSVENL